MKDANGLEIGPERPCPICKTPVATRPDGSIRAHSRSRSSLHPGLGVEACEGGAKPSTKCPVCDVEGVTYRREEEKFPYLTDVGFGVIYGVEPETIELSCVVDKGHCPACKFEFTDWRAEIAREEAVEAYKATR